MSGEGNEAVVGFTEYRPRPAIPAVTLTGKIGDRALCSETVSQIVKRHLRRVGIEPRNYGGHSLRSGGITAAYRGGASIDTCAAQAGHKKITTTVRYVRRAGIFKDNASAVMGL